jgi:glycosyltransferase involved in cell wall biosynthesis
VPYWFCELIVKEIEASIYPIMNLEKIHLCHVFATFMQGGPQVRICQVINALPECFQHTIMAMDNKTTARHLLDKSIEVRYVNPNHRRNDLIYPFRLARKLQVLKPDMVITYNWGAIEAVIASKLAGIRRVIHGEYGFGPEEAIVQKKRRLITRRILLRYVNAVIAPSLALVSTIKNVWRVPQERIAHIVNGVDCQYYSPGRNDEERERLGIPLNDCVIGTVSHMAKVKNIGFLIEAFSRLPIEWPIHLLILGDGPEKEYLVNLVRVKHVEKKVHFLGHIQKPLNYYRTMDIFALSSITEQMPVAILEAMSVGLPTVSTDVGDVRNMVSDENIPFIVPLQNKSDYQKAIECLIRNDSLRKSMGASNRKKCVEQYTFQKMIQDYHSLYYSILGISC